MVRGSNQLYCTMQKVPALALYCDSGCGHSSPSSRPGPVSQARLAELQKEAHSAFEPRLGPAHEAAAWSAHGSFGPPDQDLLLFPLIIFAALPAAMEKQQLADLLGSSYFPSSPHRASRTSYSSPSASLIICNPNLSYYQSCQLEDRRPRMHVWKTYLAMPYNALFLGSVHCDSFELVWRVDN